MPRFRRRIVLSGLAGLLASGLLAAVAAWLVRSGIITPLLPYRAVTLLLVLILGGFSLVEIPVMVLAMQRLAAERRDNRGIVWGLNTLYVFFAAVYGVPVMFLTGSLGWGLALCAFSLGRFVASLLSVRRAAP